MEGFLADEDPRDAAILKAAFEIFGRYGYRRASMADIAQAAGMSRPALYLRYTGKEEIFCRIAQRFFERVERDVEAVLARSGEPAVVLKAFFDAMDGEIVSVMLTSPHAAELIDAKSIVSGEVIATGERRMAEMLAGWIAAGQKAGTLAADLPGTPQAIAATILSAKFGLKTPGITLDAYKAGTVRLAALLGRALAVR